METMSGAAVSVESIRRPLIYVIVVEHVPQHDLISLQADLICKQKSNIFIFISSRPTSALLSHSSAFSPLRLQKEDSHMVRESED